VIGSKLRCYKLTAHGCENFHCRLAPSARGIQLLSTLQQLTALQFTSCDYSTATELPATTIAALTGLKALDASDCAPLAAAGAQQMQRSNTLGLCLEHQHSPCSQSCILEKEVQPVCMMTQGCST
jgi:hypothetical protein